MFNPKKRIGWHHTQETIDKIKLSNIEKPHYKTREWWKKNKESMMKKRKESGLKQRKRITLNCLICKKEFEVRLSKKNRKYCSKKCYAKTGMNGGNKNAILMCKLKHTGFFDSKLQSELGLRGRRKRRSNSRFSFLGVKFDSNGEKHFTEHLFNMFGFIPEEDVNCHIQMTGGEVDFKLFDIFIEYHEFKKKQNIDRLGDSPEEYFKKRRELLNKNGFENFPLLVIKTTDFMGESNE